MKLHFHPRHLLPVLAAIPLSYVAMWQTTRADGTAGGGASGISSVQLIQHDGLSSDGLVITTVTDSLGHTTKTYTDGLGRVQRKVDAEGKTTTYSYDGAGNMLSWRDVSGNGEDHAYDALNRRISTTDTAGSTRFFAYNFGGLLTSETDAKGGITRYAYDARGRQISITDPLGGVTRFAFDANGNRTAITDAEDKTTKYTFDNRNQQVAASFPAHAEGAQIGSPAFDQLQLEFDAAYHLTKITRQDGAAEALAYDFLGRLVSRTFLNANGSAESVDAFTYDANDRLLTATKGRYGNTVAFTYDALGRKASETLTIAGQTYTTQFSYDADNQLIGITYPSGKVVARAYTSRHQLASITLDGQNIATLTYDDTGRETQRNFGNGVSQTRTYYADNLLSALAVSRNGANDADLAITYNYDQNKNLIQQQFAGVMAPFSTQNSQDAKNRLTAQTQANGNAQDWNLTLEGNWAQFSGTTEGTAFAQTRTHNEKHQITLLSPAIAPQYDTKGNLITDDQGRTLVWNHENKLQAIGTTTFTYDALGRRVSKFSNGTTTLFVSANNQEIAEYINGALTKEHVYGTYVDEAIATVNANGSKHYRVMDRQYSTIALLDDQGNVVERYAYDPYGKTTPLTAAGVATGAAPLTDALWTGRKLDGETGNYYFRSRYFSPKLGRFLNRDIAGYVDGANLYEGYFAERFAMDPRGLWVWPWDPNASWNIGDTLSLYAHGIDDFGQGAHELMVTQGGALPSLPINPVTGEQFYTWDQVPTHLLPHIPQTTGTSTGISGTAGMGGGIYTVKCCFNGKKRVMMFWKQSYGGMVGIGGTGGRVTMKSCDPSSFLGWSLEVAAAVGPVGGGYAVGYNSDGTMNGTMEVSGGLGGWPKGPRVQPPTWGGVTGGAQWSYTTLISDEITNCPCD